MTSQFNYLKLLHIRTEVIKRWNRNRRVKERPHDIFPVIQTLSVFDEDRHRRCFGISVKRLFLLKLFAFSFVSSVLKPDFNLCLCKFKGVGQVGPFGTGKITLMSKATLELKHLRVRESST